MARKKKTEADNEWAEALLGSITTLFDENAHLAADDINGKSVLVIEPMEDNENFPEDLTVSVDLLGDGNAVVKLLATVYTGLPEDRTADMERLLPYLNEYLTMGHFDLLPEDGALFLSYAFVMNEEWPMESFLRIFTQTFDEITSTATDRKELMQSIMRGETTVGKLIERDDF